MRSQAEAIDGFDGTDEDVSPYTTLLKVAGGPSGTRHGPESHATDTDSTTRDEMKLQISVNGSVYDVDVEVEVEEEHLPTLGTVHVGGASPYSLTPTQTKAPAASANALTSPSPAPLLRCSSRRAQT